MQGIKVITAAPGGHMFQISDFPLSISMIKPTLLLYNIIFGKKLRSNSAFSYFIQSFISFGLLLRRGMGLYFRYHDSMGVLIQGGVLNEGGHLIEEEGNWSMFFPVTFKHRRLIL